jgi:hypothetical protein
MAYPWSQKYFAAEKLVKQSIFIKGYLNKKQET